MSTRGSKAERSSVSDQPHELKYEAQKAGTSQQDVKEAKRTAGNQRKDIGKGIKK